ASENIKPASAPNRPPRASDCILYAYTFLPRLRTASSSSRMPLSTRPHGLRIRAQTTRHDNRTRIHPTASTQPVRGLNVQGPKPTGPENGLRSKNVELKPVRPSEPPNVSRNVDARKTNRTIS